MREEDLARCGGIGRYFQPAGNHRFGGHGALFEEHRELVLGQVYRGISRPVVELQRMLDGLLLPCVDDVRRFVRIEGDRPHIGFLLGGVHVERVVGSGLIDIPSVRPLLDGKSALNGLEHEFIRGIAVIDAAFLDGNGAFFHVPVVLSRGNRHHGNAVRRGNDVSLSGGDRRYLIIDRLQHHAALVDGKLKFGVLHTGRLRGHVHGVRFGGRRGIFRDGNREGGISGSARRTHRAAVRHTRLPRDGTVNHDGCLGV